MPIKFRCPHCEQFLGISRSKAGEITDCPTCGRTIRVPTLDGNVAPLPSMEIDLKDANLRDALGALADLEVADKSADEQSVATAAPEVTTNPQAEVVDSPELRPIVVASPEKQAEASLEPLTDLSTDQALDEIAQLADRPSRPVQRPAIRKQKKSVPIVLPMTALSFLVIGFFLGRLTSPESTTENHDHGKKNSSPSNQPENVPKNNPSDNANHVSPDPGLHVFGKLTFVGNTGEPRPDSGSRVLALPVERQGTEQLPGGGFRVGASATEREELLSAIQEVGGGFDVADDDGNYRLEKLEPGEYHVLLASKYQPRAMKDLTPQLKDILSLYFDNPEKMVGRVQIEFQDVKIEPGTHIELDYEFPPG